MHQSHIVSDDEEIQLTTYLDLAQHNGFTLLPKFLHLQLDMSLSTHHLVFEYFMQWLEPPSHSSNNHRCPKRPNYYKNNWSLQGSPSNNNIIGLINEYIIITVQMVKI